MAAAIVVGAAWVLTAGMMNPASAQISAGGMPPSQLYTITSAVPTAALPVTNVADYRAEDEQQPKDVPMRFGIPLEVAYDLSSSGEWSSLPGGDRLWRLRIETPGAHSINLVYDQFFLPEGGRLFVYNDGYRYVIGAFTSFNNKDHGMFSTQPVPGDAITLEYYEPAAVQGQGVISVMRVVHAYRNLFGYADNLDDFGESGSCNNNVACDSEWDDQERGVVMLTTSGGYRYCSGSLINTVGDPGTPYILTANHCSPGPTDIAMFNYQSPTCTPTQDGPTSYTISGGTERFTTSTYNSSDCFLWELSSTPPVGYGVYYNGWSAYNTPASETVCIHHPSTDVKKISWDYDAPVSDEYGSGTNTHWRVIDWDDGTTEGGSSGSPLFDQNYRIVGQLHGGYAACGNNLSDWYGKLSHSMTSGLRSWLDPSSTGAMTLDGYDPNAVTQEITVTSPNTAVTWYVDDLENITWTSTGLSENVQIHIDRNYPSDSWEMITLSTPDDGVYPWTVTGVVTSGARIRVRGAVTTTVSDVSDVNFAIGVRSIAVTQPNTAVTWVESTLEAIEWVSQNLPGNVKIELNRTYSGGLWETIAASTPNDGSHEWSVTLPTTTQARVRISSLSYPLVTDDSDADFTIQAANQPPAIQHDRLDDQESSVPFDVVAMVTDDHVGHVTRMFYREAGLGPYDSTELSWTLNPDEYRAILVLQAGAWEYYLRVIDAGGLTTQTDDLAFEVGDFCPTEQVFDDGSAEASHWSEQIGYQWAVKFDGGGGDFVLCNARIGVSADKPNTDYSSLQVSVYLADGGGGLPGTLVQTKSVGSLGNVVGGVPIGVDNFIDVVFLDGSDQPIVVSGDFYVSVSNPLDSGFDAFLHDEDGAVSGRSVVYDPCDELWIDETDVHSSARIGNRMIRAYGFSLEPPELVIIRDGNDIRLDWPDLGAPYYRVYSALDPDGPFTTVEGTVSTNSFTDPAPFADELKFYIVRSLLQP